MKPSGGTVESTCLRYIILPHRSRPGSKRPDEYLVVDRDDHRTLEGMFVSVSEAKRGAQNDFERQLSLWRTQATA